MLFLLMGALLSCQNGETKQEAQDKKVETVIVKEVKREQVEITEHYTALLEANHTAYINSQVGGRLKAVYVSVGDKVRQGQPLAMLDDTQLKHTEIQRDKAKRMLERMTTLYEKGAIAKVQLEDLQNQYDIAKKAYDNQLENTQLSSPINGVISQKGAEVGNLTSNKKPIFVVEDQSVLKFKLNISEAYLGALDETLKAVMSVSAFPEQEFVAKLSKIYPTIDPRTHTITIEFVCDNENAMLKSGMYATICLNLGEKKLLLVPDKAIHKVMGSGEEYVYVEKEGLAHYQVLSLGRLYGSKYEVLDGLEVGDKVVISSSVSLQDGDKIKIGE